MDTIAAGTSYSVFVPVADELGNSIAGPFLDANYRVTVNGVVVSTGTVASSSISDTIPLAIGSTMTTLPDGVDLAVGEVAVDLATDNSTTTLRYYFAIERASYDLTVGVNSALDFIQAMTRGIRLVRLDAWNAATRTERIAALLSAWNGLAKLRLSERAYGTYITQVPEWMREQGCLGDMTAEQINSLDHGFLEALRDAQVIEANALLGGNDADQRRREGLVMDGIGETKQQFRDSKPLDLHVSRDALRRLSGYVSWSMGVGRA